MEFKVGSLSNLISGKSNSEVSTKQAGEQKIVYQQKPTVTLAKPKKDVNVKESLKHGHDPQR